MRTRRNRLASIAAPLFLAFATGLPALASTSPNQKAPDVVAEPAPEPVDQIRRFTFVQLTQDSGKQPPAPDDFFGYDLRVDAGPVRVGSSMEYRDVQGLMKYFGVKTPAELIGKSFESKGYNTSHYALSRMATEARHDFKYVPPTRNELRQRVARSLARLRCPDFSDVDEETLVEAFVLGASVNHEAWLKDLAESIAIESLGTVSLSYDRERSPIGSRPLLVSNGLYVFPLRFNSGTQYPFGCGPVRVADAKTVAPAPPGNGQRPWAAQGKGPKRFPHAGANSAPAPRAAPALVPK